MKKFKYLYIGVLSAILSGTFTSCEDYLLYQISYVSFSHFQTALFRTGHTFRHSDRNNYLARYIL